jgi:hypothetical protein
MQIGSGCTVHLLPSGKLVVSVSKHLTAVIDGVIHDTHDCSRAETRCVYGYWNKPQKTKNSSETARRKLTLTAAGKCAEAIKQEVFPRPHFLFGGFGKK